MSTAEEKLLKVLSDQFEQATGRAVDLSAWSLDQLVRVLNHPTEVAALCGTFGSPRSFSDATAGHFEARFKVIGPPVRQPGKPYNFGDPPGNYVANGPIPEHLRPVNPYRDPYIPAHNPNPIEPVQPTPTFRGLAASLEAHALALRDQFRGTWPEVAAFMNALDRQGLRPAQLEAFGDAASAADRAANDFADAMRFAYHAPVIADPTNRMLFVFDETHDLRRDPRFISLIHDELTVVADLIALPPREPRHAPKKPRNPFPVKAPWSRR